MFCDKCGTPVQDTNKFCSNCGNPIAQTNGAVASSIDPIKFDTKTVVCFIISAIMLLTMLVLPMFELNYDTDYKNKTYTISLLGDNYMAGHECKDDIITFSRVAFIFMLAALIALVVFRIMKKTFLSFISSGINLGILLLYDLFVDTTWMDAAKPYDDHAAIMGSGNVICLGCAIALAVICFLEFKKSKRMLKANL